MSDSLNNKELVAVGHQFAKAMSADTPIIDMAKIVSRLAERLDCTTTALREMTKQRDAYEQAERIWEKAMMQACGEDGPASVADKFAELQAKCAALGAELKAREVVMPERFDVDISPVPSPDGEWYSRDDVLEVLNAAGISIKEE